jgi:hypothetical protein
MHEGDVVETGKAHVADSGPVEPGEWLVGVDMSRALTGEVNGGVADVPANVHHHVIFDIQPFIFTTHENFTEDADCSPKLAGLGDELAPARSAEQIALIRWSYGSTGVEKVAQIVQQPEAGS